MNFKSEFLDKVVYHNSVKEWLIALSIILATILLARVVYLIISRVLKSFTGKTSTKLDDLLTEKLETPTIFFTILMGLNLSLERLNFTPKPDLYIHKAFVFLITLSITWFLVRIAHAIVEEYLRPYLKRSNNSLDEQIVLLVERGIGILLWALGIIAGLSNAGFDVGALIAGLGIGGLALALAAQDTVKNIIGGLLVFIDKPFKLGDRIKIGDFDGFVHYIGIRSTRLRTLQNRIVTIPNAQFSESAIENISSEPATQVVCTLGLDYNTPPEKIKEAMQLLRQIAKDSPLIDDTPVVLFDALNAYSLDIRFVYSIKKGADFFQAKNDVNLEVLRQFTAAGLNLAYPTQTIYRK